MNLQDRTIGFGIVGTGMIANYHALAIQEAGRTLNVRLRGVLSRGEESGRAFAEKHGIPSCTANPDEFFADGGMQVVCIATPSGAHLEPALRAIAAGKHLIVEKPLEITEERVDRMLDAADRAGVKVGAIFQARFSKGARAVKKAIDAGRFGRIVSCSAYVKWHRSAEYYRGSWKGTLGLDGGGAVMNQAIHAVDLLQWFAGMPREVYAQTTRRVHESIEAEDTASALLRYRDGALGVLEATTAAFPGWERRLEICGSQGSAVIEDDRIVRWDFREAGDEDEELREALAAGGSLSGAASPGQISIAGHVRHIEDMVTALTTGRPLEIDGREARKTVELVRAMYRSASARAPVTI